MMTYHNKTCVNMASLKISEGMTLFAVDQALAEAGLLHGSRNLTHCDMGVYISLTANQVMWHRAGFITCLCLWLRREEAGR